MKIKIGIRTRAEAECFMERGADELYCGYSTVPSHCSTSGDYRSIAQVATLARVAHAAGRKLLIAANSNQPGGSKEVVPVIRALIDAIVEQQLQSGQPTVLSPGTSVG